VEVDHAAIERSMVDEAKDDLEPCAITVSGEWVYLTIGDCIVALDATGAEELAEVLTRAAKASRAWVA
jgi:hypothetical protein